MSARKQQTKQRRSGPNIGESQRRGLKVQFRLSEVYAAALVRLAATKGLSSNIAASWLVRIELSDLGLIPDTPDTHKPEQ